MPNAARALDPGRLAAGETIAAPRRRDWIAITDRALSFIAGALVGVLAVLAALFLVMG